MTDLRKAAEQALKALENPGFAKAKGVKDAIQALRQALAERKSLAELLAATPVDETAKGEQEPVAWEKELAELLCRIHRDGGHYIRRHGMRKAIDDADLKVAELNAMSDTTPPKKEWVGLTDEELSALWVEYHGDYCIADGRIRKYEKAIEQALKEKNS